MLVTCLCLTYGRFQLLREVLTCFLAQDSDQCQLLIWNFHEVPLKLAEPYPRVHVLNKYHNLNSIESWSAALDRVKTKYVKPWLDDDLYMPWAVSQGLQYIGHRPAFAHIGRYQYRKHTEFAYYDQDPRDGANLMLDAAVARKTGIDCEACIRVPEGTLFLPPNDYTYPSWILAATEKDDCDWRKAHLLIHLRDPAYRNLVWRLRQTDTGEGQFLSPAPIDHHLAILKKHCGELIEPLGKRGM
jgi:hypothetical protein